MAAFYETLARPDERGQPTPFSFHQTVPSANPKEEKMVRIGLLWLPIGFLSMPNKANWGTTWDALEPRVLRREATRFVVQFDTVWSPPLIWAEKAAALFPRLTFRLAYSESGMEYYGLWSCNHALQETHTEQHRFAEGDKVGYRRLRDGTKELLPDLEHPDLDGYLPAGRVKAFIKQHKLRHMGGSE